MLEPDTLEGRLGYKVVAVQGKMPFWQELLSRRGVGAIRFSDFSGAGEKKIWGSGGFTCQIQCQISMVHLTFF